MKKSGQIKSKAIKKKQTIKLPVEITKHPLKSIRIPEENPNVYQSFCDINLNACLTDPLIPNLDLSDIPESVSYNQTINYDSLGAFKDSEPSLQKVSYDSFETLHTRDALISGTSDGSVEHNDLEFQQFLNELSEPWPDQEILEPLNQEVRPGKSTLGFFSPTKHQSSIEKNRQDACDVSSSASKYTSHHSERK